MVRWFFVFVLMLAPAAIAADGSATVTMTASLGADHTHEPDDLWVSVRVAEPYVLYADVTAYGAVERLAVAAGLGDPQIVVSAYDCVDGACTVAAKVVRGSCNRDHSEPRR